MKGLVKFAEGAGNMEVREVEEPKILPGYVKIEVKATGICGSDIHILHSDIAIPVRPPVVTGHEFSGIVVEVGDGVTTCKVGDRVTSKRLTNIAANVKTVKMEDITFVTKEKHLGTGITELLQNIQWCHRSEFICLKSPFLLKRPPCWSHLLAYVMR